MCMFIHIGKTLFSNHTTQIAFYYTFFSVKKKKYTIFGVQVPQKLCAIFPDEVVLCISPGE